MPLFSKRVASPWVVGLGLMAGLIIAADQPVVFGDNSAPTASPAAVPNNSETSIHLLNRLGYGPRPGDVERVQKLGWQRYVDEQLHPERIPDTAMAARLSPLTTLTMSTRELADKYYIPMLMERRERQLALAAQGDTPGQPAPTRPRPNRPQPGNPENRPQPGNPDMTANPEMAPPPGPEDQGRRAVLGELGQAKLLRAVYSDRQLEEVMVDFWFNHFNVFAGKGATNQYLTEYERDVIRPHVFGNFRDLLGAVAESPAMLFYLDNWMSVDPNAGNADLRDRLRRGGIGQQGRNPQRRPGQVLRRPGQQGRPGIVRPGGQGANGGDMMAGEPRPPQRQQRGINENYARELMELHTLGVDGGYAQKDVQEVARAFTGWTIDQPRAGGSFRFNPRVHDNKEKVVLGHTLKAGRGKEDGEEVLDLVAKHPSTAKFIATKLARRFVADEPPKTIVDKAAARFLATNGDIREVVRTIVTSDEFFAASVRRAKVKTPLEFVASAVRATNAKVDNAMPLVQAMRQLGMPIYGAQPPTGYADRADAWVNTGALVNRMNFAVSLVSNKLRGITVDLDTLVASGEQPGAARDRLVRSLLAAEPSATTMETVRKAEALPQLAALTIGAPEFQRR